MPNAPEVPHKSEVKKQNSSAIIEFENKDSDSGGIIKKDSSEQFCSGSLIENWQQGKATFCRCTTANIGERKHYMGKNISEPPLPSKNTYNYLKCFLPEQPKISEKSRLAPETNIFGMPKSKKSKFLEQPCDPSEVIIPEYLGKKRETFLESARLGLILFKKENHEDRFDPTPGSGRPTQQRQAQKNTSYEKPRVNDYSNFSLFSRSVAETEKWRWTPFKPEEIWPLIKETIMKKEKEAGLLNNKDDKIPHPLPTSKSTKVDLSSYPSARRKPLCIIVPEHSDPNWITENTKVKIIQHNSQEDEESLAEQHNCLEKKIRKSSPKISLLLPQNPLPVPSESISESYEMFPPLIDNGFKTSCETFKRLIATPMPIPIRNKPRIPSLMDLRISTPLHKRKKPKLPILADSIILPIRSGLKPLMSEMLLNQEQLCEETNPTNIKIASLMDFHTSLNLCHRARSALKKEEGPFESPLSNQPSVKIPSPAPILPATSIHKQPFSSEPRIIKISERKAPQSPHKKTRNPLFLVASRPPIKLSDIVKQIDFERFLHNWTITRTSAGFMDPNGCLEFGRIQFQDP